MAPNFKMMADGAKAIANIHTAVAEFVDNSFDAKASNIQITTNGQLRNYDLYIKDDGVGIPYSKLLESLKGGTYSDKSNTNEGTFGCKGVGLKYASIYLALESCEIYSKCEEDEEISYGMINLNSIHTEEGTNDWNSIYITKKIDLFSIEDQQVYDWFKNRNKGTVVKLTKMNTEVCGPKKKFDTAIYDYDKGIAHMYRHIFKQRETLITLNGLTFTPKGPGFGYKEKFKDKVFFVNNQEHQSDADGWIPHDVYLKEETEPYRVKFRFIREATESSLGTNANSQKGGLLILREMRGVTTQKLTGFKDHNWGTGNLVIELSCPATFIDRTLTFNGDKQIRSVESKLSSFDFKTYFKNIFSKFQKDIILINKQDALANGSEAEKRKAIDLQEKDIVKRFIEQKKEAYQEDHSIEEVESWIEEEYCPQGSNSRIDLVWRNTPFEFKKEVTNINAVVGQILCYIPYLIKEDRFLNDKKECVFNLAIYSKPSENLKSLISTINQTVKFGDVSVKIQIIDLHKNYSKLFSYPKTSEEKQINILAA